MCSGLLICYTLLLTVLEISLLKRPIRRIAGLEMEEYLVEEMLYDPALDFLTSAILINTYLFAYETRSQCVGAQVSRGHCTGGRECNFNLH
jgi:hypothetical protein